MVDQVAKALCEAAGKTSGCKADQIHDSCQLCERKPDGARFCTFWPSFTYEAEQAILAAYKWHKEHRRWPGWIKI